VFDEEAANTHFIVVGSTRPGLEPTIYCTLTITPPMRFMCWWWVDIWCLTPLSTIFQLYRDGSCWWYCLAIWMWFIINININIRNVYKKQSLFTSTQFSVIIYKPTECLHSSPESSIIELTQTSWLILLALFNKLIVYVFHCTKLKPFIYLFSVILYFVKMLFQYTKHVINLWIKISSK
jgi:hypothetical protein